MAPAGLFCRAHAPLLDWPQNLLRSILGLKNLEVSTSLDDLRTFFIQKLVTAIGAEKLDLLVAKLLIVTIKLAAALRAGHPKDFRHGSS
jgi:hypothetical protein